MELSDRVSGEKDSTFQFIITDIQVQSTYDVRRTVQLTTSYCGRCVYVFYRRGRMPQGRHLVAHHVTYGSNTYYSHRSCDRQWGHALNTCLFAQMGGAATRWPAPPPSAVQPHCMRYCTSTSCPHTTGGSLDWLRSLQGQAGLPGRKAFLHFEVVSGRQPDCASLPSQL